MGNRCDLAAVRRSWRALVVVSVLVPLAVLGYRWKPGGTWSESEAARTDAHVADVEWLDDDTFPRLMCMRTTWRYQDHSGENHSFTTRGSWLQKPQINGEQILESSDYVRTDLLDHGDTWIWNQASAYPPMSVGEMLDFERSYWANTKKIKYLIDKPEQWRDAAKDDNGEYLNKPAWVFFLVVAVPGFLALVILHGIVKELFPGRMERRRRFQGGS